MNIRWLFGNFTDPQYKLPRREQFRLSNKAHLVHVSTGAFLWRTAIITAPFLVLFALLGPIVRALGYPSSSMAWIIGAAILLVLFWPWCAWMYRALYVVPIRKVMREAGYDLCLQCGYELRALPTDVTRCPECGAARPPNP